MAEKVTQELERIYTIPLRAVKASPRNHRADRAIRYIRAYLTRHMDSEEIWIDASVNEHLWAHGMYAVPSRIRVRARRFDDGVVEVSLPEVEAAASIRGAIQERREKADEEKKKKKEAAKEEKPAEGEAPPAAPPVEERKKTPWAERKLIDIEGIGPKYDAQLAPHGIRLMDDLVKADLAALGEKTGLSMKLLEAWRAMADLDRLETVSNQYAELLARAGVAGVEALAKESPEAVVRKINQYLATVEKPPTQLPVNETLAVTWIQEARKLQGAP